MEGWRDCGRVWAVVWDWGVFVHYLLHAVGVNLCIMHACCSQPASQLRPLLPSSSSVCPYLSSHLVTHLPSSMIHLGRYLPTPLIRFWQTSIHIIHQQQRHHLLSTSSVITIIIILTITHFSLKLPNPPQPILKHFRPVAPVPTHPPSKQPAHSHLFPHLSCPPSMAM